MKFSLLISLIILTASIPEAIGQKNLAIGNRLFDQNNFEGAIPFFKKEINKGDSKSKIEAMKRLAQTFELTNQFDEAEHLFYKILKRKRKEPANTLNYALALKNSAKYAEAKEQFLKYAKLMPEDPSGNNYAISCDSAQKWLDEVPEIETRELSSINTTGREFSPLLAGGQLIFCSSRMGGKRSFFRFDGGSKDVALDIFTADLFGSEFPQVVLLPAVNTAAHEGPSSFNSSVDKLFISRTVLGKKSKKSNTQNSTLQIHFYEKENEIWVLKENVIPFNSDKYSVGHPSLTPDEKSLYFMSDMPGGHGGTDIYVSHWDGSSWGDPVNLGPGVNTKAYELFPYIHTDGTLFFASDGHPGMGKMDIFQARSDQGNWGQVSNLKPPLNSIWDDFGLFMDPDNYRGFFSSNRYNGSGGDDLYSFIKKAPVKLKVTGNYVELEDLRKFNDITYQLSSKELDSVGDFTIKGGKYTAYLQEGISYLISARKDGFRNNKITIRLNESPDSATSWLDISSQSRPIELNGVLLAEGDPHPISGVGVALWSMDKLYKEVSTSLNGHFTFTLSEGTEYSIYLGELSEQHSPVVPDPVAVLEDEPEEADPPPTVDTAQTQIAYELDAVSVEELDLSLPDIAGQINVEDTTEKAEDATASGEDTTESTIVLITDTEVKTTVTEVPTKSAEPASPITEKATPDPQPLDVVAMVSIPIDLPLIIHFKDPEPVENVKVEIKNEGEVVANLVSDPQGVASHPIQEGVSYTISASKLGYVSCDTFILPTSQHEDDPLLFDIYLQKKETVHFEGIAEVKGVPVEDALSDLFHSGAVVDSDTTDQTGTFEFELYRQEQYNVVTTKEGYFQDDLEVSTENMDEDEIKVKIDLAEIEFEKPVRIKNIYYDFNSAKLRSSAHVELDKLLTFLAVNRSVGIELGSHTDEIGDAKFNMGLSQRRANGVTEYLHSKGITQNRVLAIGYGEQRPVIKNAHTAEQHQQNRRTEFKVIEDTAALALAIRDRSQKQETLAYLQTYLPTGICFVVQIGASKVPLPENFFRNASTVYLLQSPRMYRYITGVFKDLDEAFTEWDKSQKLIRKDAFISAYKDGKKITIKSARKLLEKDPLSSGKFDNKLQF